MNFLFFYFYYLFYFILFYFILFYFILFYFNNDPGVFLTNSQRYSIL